MFIVQLVIIRHLKQATRVPGYRDRGRWGTETLHLNLNKRQIARKVGSLSIATFKWPAVWLTTLPTAATNKWLVFANTRKRYLVSEGKQCEGGARSCVVAAAATRLDVSAKTSYTFMFFSEFKLCQRLLHYDVVVYEYFVHLVKIKFSAIFTIWWHYVNRPVLAVCRGIACRTRLLTSRRHATDTAGLPFENKFSVFVSRNN